MEITKADLKDNKIYYFELEEIEQEGNIKRTFILQVDKKDIKSKANHSTFVETEKIQDFILSKVKTLCVYIANEKYRRIFFKVIEMIVKNQKLPINVKNTVYPGSSIVLLECGILGVEQRDVEGLAQDVMIAIDTAQVEAATLEEPEPEPEPIDIFDAGEEPFPLGGEGADFVEDDFNVGVIEEEGEEND